MANKLYSTIGYFRTRQEALQALADYNNNPYDLIMSKYTFSEVYQKWFDSVLMILLIVPPLRIITRHTTIVNRFMICVCLTLGFIICRK